jgi:hypothetical protein
VRRRARWEAATARAGGAVRRIGVDAGRERSAVDGTLAPWGRLMKMMEVWAAGRMVETGCQMDRQVGKRGTPAVVVVAVFDELKKRPPGGFEKRE